MEAKESEAKKYLNYLLEHGSTEKADEAAMRIPPWYREDLYNKARHYYFKYLFIMLGAMLCGLVAVISIPSILKVLICTKQSSVPATAYRRYVRTIFHIFTWNSHPLKEGSPSWKSLEMIRKNHARSSKLSEKSMSGIITQKDLALTQFGFMGFLCLSKKSIQEDDKDYRDALVHFWRVIGYMLGIKDEYNLCTDSWETTKPRLLLVRDQIYKPCLEKPVEQFNEMAKALLNGLWYFNPSMTVESTLFVTKWFAHCDGYQFFDDDYDGEIPKGNSQRVYKSLGLYDKFTIASGLYLGTYWNKYTLVRLYLNLRTYLTLLMAQYLPFMAGFKFGFRWAHIRLFSNTSTEEHIHKE